MGSGVQKLSDFSISRKIELWKGKLLDISLKNRLVNFREGSLHLKVLHNGAGSLYREAVNEGRRLTFAKGQAVQPRQGTLNSPYSDRETHGKLYKMYLSANESIMEQAVNTLYMSFGMLEYEDKESGSVLRAPLVLVPMSIERRKDFAKSSHPFSVSFLDDDIHTNPALRHKLQSQYDIDIGDEPEDLDEYLQSVREKILPHGWALESEEVYIGIFSFQKLSLYQDIEKNRELIMGHPIINSLCGGLSPSSTWQGDTEEIDPKESLFVLDADSSQQEAVLAARAGQSFVLQGPPGTGKSQTIANIISQLLADGKKVLFVSEKMAALEVVKKRLDAAGIGHYMLEMHNANTAGKRWVLEQLDNALAENKLYCSDDRLISQLSEARKTLSEYGSELIGDSGDPLPPYKMFGRLAQLSHIRFADMGAKPDTGYDTFRENMRILEEIDLYVQQLAEYNTSFLKHINHKQLGVFTDMKRDRLNEDLDTAIEHIEYMKKHSEAMLGITGLKFGCVLDFKMLTTHIPLLLNIPCTQYKWAGLLGADIAKFERLVEKYSLRLQEHEALTKYFTSKYKEGILDGELFVDLKENFVGKYSLVIMRWVDPRYRFYISKVRSLLKDDRALDYAEVADDISQLGTYRKICIELRQDAKEIIGVMGPYTGTGAHDAAKGQGTHSTNTVMEPVTIWDSLAAGEAINISEIREMLKWLRSAQSVEGLLNSRLKTSLSSGADITGLSGELLSCADRLMDAYLRITEAFEGDAVERHLKCAGWQALEERLQRIRDSSGSISKWVEFKAALDRLGPEIRKIFEKCMLDRERNYKVSELYEKVYLQERLSGMGLSLAKKNREYLDLVQGKFKEGDMEHKFYSRNRIIGMIESKKPKISLTSRSSEVGILRKEIAKSRRHKPLRRLFSEISSLVFVLKPCFMMSPLSVARFIDPEVMQFDTVIFDEASQVMVEDAISSIIRSRQAIIVGDSKQLPPTMFFKVNEDIDVEEGLEEAPSILDEASSALGMHMLRWHYRSRDESLISFSNRHFYNNRLVTFPSSRAGSFGIGLVHVEDGMYDRGGTRQNRVEAKKIVRLVKEHFDKYPEKSLGVIAFSIAQQQAIIEELDLFLERNPSYTRFMNGDGLRSFFIKNLETVQGDEREVVILSIGYGRDGGGTLSLNFGPLNREGGVKRLNVAISRAIERVIVVSSILPEEIDESRTSSEGMHMLKRYLEYARSGTVYSSEGDASAPQNDLQEAVYKALSSAGLEVQKSVGSSSFAVDVAVRDPSQKGRYALAIELDSSAYLNTRSTRDRDRIRGEVLESLGWKVHRIWSYSWVLNSEKEVEKIISLLSDGGPNAGRQDAERAHARIERIDSELSFAIRDYPSTAEGSFGTREDFMEFDFFRHAKEIVKTESPICSELLMKRIFDGYGVADGKRARRRFSEIMGAHLPNEDVFVDDEGVFWAEQPRFFYNVRRSRADARPPNMIPLPEIRLAALIVADNAISISKKDIPKEVVNLFDAGKITPKMKARVNMAVDELVSRDYLLIEGDKVSVNSEFGKEKGGN